ncbi:hypothetical protein RI129_002735 [Pyrocoelia pectoralis]|uniref:Reverse transcriptase domain-containing protein n=1 Tax=Pyrocoelia pectoralis TaxID=417401 RepID=A0AAN7ZU16_9COLE
MVTDLSDNQVTCIISLLKLCLKQNFFKFKDKFYAQIDGLAMGSNLSPLLAEVFMNNLELHSISTLKFYKDYVIFWGRYVDDIICLHTANDNEVIDFLQEINLLHPKINFTMEKESNAKLPFLDVLLHRSHSHIDFSIYRKPTTTENLIPFDSEHPISHKLAGLNSLLYRLFNIPMSKSHFEEELNVIKQIAVNNDYPVHLVNKLAQKFRHSFNTTRLLPIKVDTTNVIYRSLPFYPKISYSIHNIFKSYNIHISFSNFHTLRSSIVRNKDRQNLLDASGVYQLNCNSCPSFYIGQTGRSFTTRISEHVKAIKNNNYYQKSAMAEHILSTGHSFDSKIDFSILHKCKKGPLLNSLEIFEISRQKHHPGLLNEVVDFQSVMISSLCM